MNSKSKILSLPILNDGQKKFSYVELMSTGSVNLYKSFTYAQPETYHFSHDSVFLARNVFELVRDEKLPSTKVLDLCAGCGIVGLDYAFHQANELGASTNMDFVEVQEVYEPFIQKNTETFQALFPGRLASTFLFKNYEDLHCQPELKEKYDLIICNPPYFRVGQGKLSPSEFKNRCRFFIDSGFTELVHAMNYLLTPGGSAFVLLQSLRDHKIDVLDEVSSLGFFTVKNRGLIRATGFYQLIKNF